MEVGENAMAPSGDSNNAWPLLLQHPSIKTKLRVASRLLCCNKQLHAAVSKYSAGQLRICIAQPPYGSQAPVSARLQRYWDQTRWISKHGMLLLLLDVKGSWEPAAGPAQLTLETALKAAATRPSVTGQQPPGLLLQSFSTSSQVSKALLQLLPASTLIALDITLPEHSTEVQIRLAAEAIAQFSNLQQLTIQEGSKFMASFKDALCSLKRLLVLEVAMLREQFTQLQDSIPDSVTDLDVGLDARSLDTKAALQLSHLTALTALRFTPNSMSLQLLSGDILPPNLINLDATVDSTLQPIVALSKLQHLNLRASRQAARDLQQLTALTTLTIVRLFSSPGEHASSTAAVWPLLPLAALRPRNLNISAIQHMATLRGLTMLLLEEPIEGCTYGQFAAALQQLTALQNLHLFRTSCLDDHQVADDGSSSSSNSHDTDAGNISDDSHGVSSGNRSGGWRLMHAVAGLPSLTGFGVAHLAPCRPSLLPLQQSTNLTSLHVMNCQVPSGNFSRIVQRLTGLLELDVARERSLDDDAVSAICSNLTRLTKLALRDVGLTPASLPNYLKLTSLLELAVPLASLDEQLLQLSSLTNLTRLDVQVSSYSAFRYGAAQSEMQRLVRELRVLKPYCEIDVSDEI